MKEALNKWLQKFHQTFDADTAHSLCSRFGLDGEKADECLGLCYQLEKGDITETDFTGGVCVLTGKEPEEVMGVLRGMKSGGSPERQEKFIHKIDGVPLTGRWREIGFDESKMREGEFFKGATRYIAPGTLERVIVRPRDEIYGLVGKDVVTGKRKVWFLQYAQVRESKELGEKKD